MTMITEAEPKAGSTLARLSKLADHAYRIRRFALRMGEVQGCIGQALGLADALAVAWYDAMNLRPDDPEWEGRDRFLLSHGHYAIALYPALIEAGVIPEAKLEIYGSDDSRLPMSGMASYTPGMEISGGSLGQDLTIAVGMALGLRLKGNPAFVYNSMSNGELDEGATWEAALPGLTTWLRPEPSGDQRPRADARDSRHDRDRSVRCARHRTRPSVQSPRTTARCTCACCAARCLRCSTITTTPSNSARRRCCATTATC
ncbi:Transketolase, N-terminal section [Candidatus Burkholderia brachyanthoides]|nr:Transketolase, N-terminal section [Candidatus Burkholderia brachyanthoides]